jgi:hypothetical protein
MRPCRFSTLNALRATWVKRVPFQLALRRASLLPPWAGSSAASIPQFLFTSEEPFHPDQAQVVIHIVLAESLYSKTIRSVLQVQEAIEIFLDDDVAEIHGNGPHEIQFFFVPQLFGDISDSDFKGLLTANLVARTAAAAMNGVEIRRNGMAGFTEWTNNDMSVDGSPKFSHKPCR